MGVITEIDIDYGRIFGPFPAVGHIPQAHFIGLLSTDDRSEARNIKIDLNERSLGNSWLPYVHPARTVEEQNVEAYTKDGLIYYRTLRIIRADEELLVWYSKDFAQILDIPDIKRQLEHDDNAVFTCEYCREKFRFLFPLIAHVRFKCTRNVQRTTPVDKDSTETNTREQFSPGTSESKSRAFISNHNIQTLKRSSDTDQCSVPHKRLSVEVSEENNNDKIPRKTSPSSKSDHVSSEGFSAFRKVEKSHAEDVSVSANNVLSMRETHDKSEVRTFFTKQTVQSNRFNDTLTTGLGMLMPNWFAHHSPGGQAYLDPRLYSDRLATSSADKIDVINRINGMNANAMRNFQSSELMNRQNIMLMEQLRKSQLPAIPTANPMVEKILSTTTAPTLLQRPLQQLNLAQNWCAKCNATFRMTSDLVYHMRSHHKREFDPMKRKREDKLQCSVCKETFKERHHLTRHMTSHA